MGERDGVKARAVVYVELPASREGPSKEVVLVRFPWKQI